MIETAVVIDLEGKPLYWHVPEGRSAIAIPDSRFLNEVLFRCRNNISGVAHSHPGRGEPSPSNEDKTTFAAIEGDDWRLSWWITSEDCLIVCRWVGPGRLDYDQCLIADTAWVHDLRKFSYNEVGDHHGYWTK